MMMNLMNKKYASLALLLLIVATLTVSNFVTFQVQGNRVRRSLQATSYMVDKVLPFDAICQADTPPKHGTLHNKDKEVIEHYNTHIGRITNGLNRGDDMPQLVTRQNVKYAFWNKGSQYSASLWTWNKPNDFLNAEHGGFMKPKPADAARDVTKVFTGDWAVFHGMWFKSYGHYGHDHLPTIAFLRTSVPESTQFLLVDHPIARRAIETIDPTFYRRITWIQPNTVYHIKGSLTVAVRRAVTHPVGCCAQFDPLRNWMAESLPEDPPQKTVVYYQRRGSGSRSRLLDEDNEKQILEHIEAAMKRHGMMEEKLVVFNGRNPGTNETMSVYNQFRLFRSAKTIIGPEGSGIGGNFVYTKPNPQNCEERVQLLEFMGGRDTPEIHDGTIMATHYQSIRKWPIQYHNIYFTPNSNKWTTYVNLDDLDSALDAMWGNNGGGVGTSSSSTVVVA